MNCSFPDCLNEAKAAGFCTAHYQQRYRHQVMKPLNQRRVRKPKKCCAACCKNMAIAHGLCNRHYLQMRAEEARRRMETESALDRARTCYDRAIGLQTRLDWKWIIKQLEQELQEVTA